MIISTNHWFVFFLRKSWPICYWHRHVLRVFIVLIRPRSTMNSRGMYPIPMFLGLWWFLQCAYVYFYMYVVWGHFGREKPTVGRVLQSMKTRYTLEIMMYTFILEYLPQEFDCAGTVGELDKVDDNGLLGSTHKMTITTTNYNRYTHGIVSYITFD